MTAAGSDAAARRLLVVADADSYLKWGAALASTLPAPWGTRIVVVASPVMPSANQTADALAGTRFGPDDVAVIGLDDLDALLDAVDPHAVLLALRGPFVRVLAPRIERRPNRPVIVSGFPGLTIPAAPKAVIYREQTDLVVLHSRREVREFRANAAELDIDRTFALATLPFLATTGDARSLREQSETKGREPVPARSLSERSETKGQPAGDVVFAAQAMVPVGRDDRLRLLGALADLARAQPERRVVVKVRARRGEAQTHYEQYDYADLLAEFDDAPANLVVEDGPMAEKLARADALVTVSSTAVLEAIALGMPALLVDDFGVSARMINLVFEGSGLFGSLDDLAAGRFRVADPAWTHDNYFHGAASDDWIGRLESFVAARELVPLPRLDRRRDLAGGALRWAFERRRMLGEYDTSRLGSLAWAVGVPARSVVRRMRRVQRWLREEDRVERRAPERVGEPPAESSTLAALRALIGSPSNAPAAERLDPPRLWARDPVASAAPADDVATAPRADAAPTASVDASGAERAGDAGREG